MFQEWLSQCFRSACEGGAPVRAKKKEISHIVSVLSIECVRECFCSLSEKKSA